MENLRTTDLENELLSAKDDAGFKEFTNKYNLLENATTLRDYFDGWFAAHPHLVVADVIKAANMDRGYAYQILNGTRTKPSKYKLVSLCLCSGMNVEETQRALKLADAPILYIKTPADAALIYCINNGYNTMLQVLSFFEENGMRYPG